MQIGVHCVRGNIPHDACRACALDPLHPCDYAPDVLELMRGDDEDEPGVDAYSPTRIISCNRRAVLQRHYDYYADVDRQYPLTRGHMVHALMERATYPGAVRVIREVRLSVPVTTPRGTVVFQGKPDAVVVQRIDADGTWHVKIVDYKSIGEIGHDDTRAKPQHQWQLNMYAWLVVEAYPTVFAGRCRRVVVHELELNYCSMKKSRIFTSAGWRTARGRRLTRTPPYRYETLDLEPIELYPPKLTGLAIRRRIEARQAAFEELPDPLEGDEAWVCEYCPVRDVCVRLAKEGVRVLPGGGQDAAGLGAVRAGGDGHDAGQRAA